MKSEVIQPVEPFIPASKTLPEITIKSFTLGLFLALLMAASNAYLALKAGLTISACIPAAVISMAILKMFRNSNLLENNIVQTTASAGEVTASGLAYTLPALVMVGYWNSFPYMTIITLAIIGGLLGILFSIPLRKAMVVESPLRFPEGIATAEILKAGTDKGAAKDILFAGLSAAVIKVCQSGFQFLADSIHIWGRVGSTVVGINTGFSLALAGAGYVAGLPVAVNLVAGAILGWIIGVPLYGALFGLPLDAGSSYEAAVDIWNSKIRIIGVGMMVFGGLWLLIELVKPIRSAIASSLAAFRKIKVEGLASISRVDMDIPITYVLMLAAFIILPTYILFDSIITNYGFPLSSSMLILLAVAITFLVFIVSAMGSSISSYMCGLLGSSNTPLSGIILMSILLFAFILFIFLSSQIDLSMDADSALNAAGITIIFTALVGTAGALGSNNLQTLKSGQILGGTPWRQQLMLIIGMVVSALILAPIFQLLFEAYGFADVLPREGMDPAQALSVPKAALMAAVSQGVFNQTMDWSMVITGVILGMLVILLDKYLEKIGFSIRLHLLGVAVGIYMPLEVTVPIFAGGILSHLSGKSLKRAKVTDQEKSAVERRGVLFASGLIAGEAIIGIFLAIPFVIYSNTQIFRIVPEALQGSTDVLGLLVFFAMLYWFYQVCSKAPSKAK